jgi:SNF2 family DNA or RNA helicase
MSSSELLERIRNLRKLEEISLKTSSYFRPEYIDDYGEVKQISLRNYQKIGVMNLLQVSRMVLADGTGLGKTIQILSGISYIWLKEPEYVPIIITTKSALFQWTKETNKFMKDMEPVTVHGQAIERDRIYKDFFLNYDQSKKRVLILTYDNIMYDLEPTMVRDHKIKPRKTYKQEVGSAKKEFDAAKVIKKAAYEFLESSISGDLILKDHAASLLKWMRDKNEKFPIPPPLWGNGLDKLTHEFFNASVEEQSKKLVYDNLISESSIPVFGIESYILSLKIAHPEVKFMLVMDEAHKLKNHKSKFHEKTERISKLSTRVVAVTATPVKNRLMEFFSLFKIVVPGLFPKISHFQNDYCITKMQRIGGGRQVPVIVGYKNLDAFISKIEFYYLSRKTHEVAKDLPDLLSREIECELSDEQEELYDLAENGLLIKNNDSGEMSEQGEILAALTSCQQAANSPRLVKDAEGDPFEGTSSKLDALLDLIEEDSAGQKLIVFSRFETMISEIGSTLEEKKIKYVRITGKENSPKVREEAKTKFQDPNSGVDVILLTNAGSESINLQAAEHFVFFDLPWSAGDYFQLIGRMIRIGSSHKTVVAHHMLAKRQSGEKTVDHHVLAALREKKKLIDKVAGNNLVGGFTFADENIAKDVINMMRGKMAGDPGTLLAQVNERQAKRKAAATNKSAKTPKKAAKMLAENDISEHFVVDFGDL